MNIRPLTQLREMITAALRSQTNIGVWRESYYVNEPLANREDEESLLYEPYFKYVQIG